MGLYHDDWVLHFKSPSWGNTQDTFRLFANRPLQGLYLIGTSWIGQGSPAALQIFSALLVLITALTIRKLFRTIASYALYEDANLGCNISVFLWLMMPWTLGTTAWIIAAPSLISVIGFCAIGVILLKTWMGKKVLMPWLPLAILSTALSYEMFIPQIPLLIGMYYIRPGRPLRSAPISLFPISVISGISLGIALIIRKSLEVVGSMQASGPVIKSFYGGWFSLFQTNLSGNWMVQAFEGCSWLARLSLLMALSLAILVYLSSLQDHAYQLRVLLVTAVVSVAGISLSSLVPALAGYGISGHGLSSRVSIGISLWLSLWAAVIFVVSLRQCQAVRSYSVLAGSILAFSFVVAMCIQLSSWAAVWKSQLRLLNSIDTSAIALLPSSSVIVLDRPIASEGVYGFNSEWDLSYALSGIIGSKLKPRLLVASDYWKVYNVGDRLVQRAGSNKLADYTYSQAWILSAQSGMIRTMRMHEVVGGADLSL